MFEFFKNYETYFIDLVDLKPTQWNLYLVYFFLLDCVVVMKDWLVIVFVLCVSLFCER
jgi:hypothetical protein